MPALGVAQDTGRVVQWMVTEGGVVSAGEPLVEIETDKVTVSIDAPASGVLSAVRAGDGDEAPVGEVIAWILAPGEEPPEPAERPTHDAERGSGETHGAQREASSEPSAVRAERSSTGAAGRPAASPLARRRAKEAGIDLAKVPGTGPEGAVTAADLDLLLATGAASSTPSAGAQEEGPSEVGAIWRRMAERVTASWTSAPHFYLSREVDAERLVARRAALGEGITLTDLLVWASAKALESHPEANAVWDGGAPKRIGEVNVAIAVAVPDGLVVPVVHGANGLSATDVAERRRDLVTRARSGALRPEDVTGGTFTLSNLGMFGVDSFAAVLNGPQAAILAVGRVSDRVVAVDGHPEVRPRMSLTLSCDHRVLDGARAARFLDTLAEFIEEPPAQ